ncbi:6-hydroxymethylpterin diphosphokinase MptE-like protein [Halarcobacter sp.]|uniref:6-hydroxymethylpterin diphosphokinase MptE-like protein n=1 Tax=Halarcobacter sp. TaxID=2321133 RepID=UPI002AABAD7F|nr:6-hydroxymethylpterin diphosphokinase MptE-like protein [Halarcobacter sp.]
MNELEELQNTLFTIYKKNLEYLNKNYPTIHKKILDFEHLNIETKYIDFKNGYFELVDNENFTYNCNSFYDAEQRAKSIKESSAIFSMLVEDINSKNYNMKNEISAHKYVEKYLHNNSTKNTKKFIFIGTLLGIHINEIHKVLLQKSYLIIEPSIETFRLSLFFTDYEEISKKSKLFFCVNENDLELKSSLKEFLDFDFSYNNYIKFELASEKELYLIDKLKNLITSSNPFIHPFSEDIISLERGFRNINHTNGLIKSTYINLFDKNSILILGAGPSLEEKQLFIKQNSNKFIIMCASASLKRLEAIDVIPDIIVNIDKKENEILEQFNVNEKYYINSIIFLGIKTNPKVLKKLALVKNIFTVQENYQLFKNTDTIECVSVGDFMYSFAIRQNPSELYLLGIDASFDDKKTHDSLHLSSKKILDDNTYENIIIEVEGNFKKRVKTNLLYAEIINSFEKIPKKDINLFNLSNGAKLKNIKPLKSTDRRIKNLKNINKIKFQIEAINKLEINSKKNFPMENKNELKIIKKLNQKISDKDILSLKQKYPNSKSLNILVSYLKLINPYLSRKEDLDIKNSQIKEIISYLDKIFS